MDLVSDLASECFSAIGRLRALDEPVASPEAVQVQMRSLLDSFKERARQAGVSDKDAQDSVYALVALMDEVALRAPEPLRGYWMNQPLQLHFFGENLAGEGFFARLDSLLADGRRLAVLRVYQFCLSFGFQGKYGLPGGEVELMRLAETVRNQVQHNQEVPRAPNGLPPVVKSRICVASLRCSSVKYVEYSPSSRLGPLATAQFHSVRQTVRCSSALSPAGEAPDEPLLRSARRNLWLWVSLGIFALALTVFVGLRISFDRQVGDLASRVDEIAP